MSATTSFDVKVPERGAVAEASIPSGAGGSFANMQLAGSQRTLSRSDPISSTSRRPRRAEQIVPPFPVSTTRVTRSRSAISTAGSTSSFRHSHAPWATFH